MDKGSVHTPATVFFVGAGPGDPELITVKGARLLAEADVVLYAGSLVHKKVLAYCRPDAELCDSAPMDLEQITDLMVKAVQEGKRVVRLHSGDPTFYSALAEQAQSLVSAGIPFEVVPGVSSVFASAAALKTELTIPELTQTIILTRAAGRTPVPETEALSELARHRATICIFLSVAMIERVVEELGEGYPSTTPVAVIHRVGWEDELIVRGTLEDIAEKVKTAGIEKQAMIIVGEVIAASEKGAKRSKLYAPDFKHGSRK